MINTLSAYVSVHLQNRFDSILTYSQSPLFLGVRLFLQITLPYVHLSDITVTRLNPSHTMYLVEHLSRLCLQSTHILNSVVFWFIPESPVWLFKQGKLHNFLKDENQICNKPLPSVPWPHGLKVQHGLTASLNKILLYLSSIYV